ncbi:MAG: tRNA epoxyqueuosine(34) reductase QueG [Planctomycetota bacterium]|jgi:epoxyqueuosine reductase
MSLSQDIKDKTIDLGFDLVGVTGSAPIDGRQAEAFAVWLESGFAGQMGYMHRNLRKRLSPAKLMEGAQSVIVVGLNYTPPERRGTMDEGRGTRDEHRASGRVANYALYEDYHQFLKERLRDLIGYLNSLVGATFKFRICADSVPLAERALAVRAGLGFIGRNHMLINPEFGCQVFLGEIVSSLKLKHDEPIAADCSGCHKCIDACPTGALRSDGQFDAGRCINYLTIEYKGPIAPELATKIGDRLFGCDECVLACPYQTDAPPRANRQFRFCRDRARLELGEIMEMDAESFEARFGDSPIKRLGLEGLKRNARICLANAGL